MDSQNHNKWSDKLNQFPTPDETESWNRMQVLLDTHLPKQKSNWRYAAIALLLLLLVVGICNYAPLRKGDSSLNKNHVQNESATGSNAQKQKSLVVADKTKSDTDKEKANGDVINGSNPKENNQNSSSDHVRSSNTDDIQKHKKHSATRKAFGEDEQNKKSSSDRVQSFSTISKRSLDKNNKSYLDKEVAKTDSKPELSTASGSLTLNQKGLNKPTAGNGIIKAGNADQTPSSEKVVINKVDTTSIALIKDSTSEDILKANVSTPKTQAKKKNAKLTFGTGLNHFSTVNEQEKSAVNPKGNSNPWSNYFPVIMGRYYIKDWLYLQAELQLSTPQYTNRILLEKKVSPQPGPSPAANIRIEKTIYTEKLFYVDVPVSLNISPIKNVFLGGGLQYSNLRKAVGLYEEKLISPGRPDSLISNQTKPIDEKLATTTFKPNEWRYNLNGTVKLNRFDVGLRYTKSLNPFTNNVLMGYSNSQTTNSSISLFLRYELVRIGSK
jgi:hypothetical protein